MTDETQNPREKIGGNNPPEFIDPITKGEIDLPKEVQNFLSLSYDQQTKHVDELLERARQIPAVIEDQQSADLCADIIKELRDLSRALNSNREKEKSPWFRAAQVADAFFFPLMDKLARRQAGNRPGAADSLQARLDKYVQAKLFKEREERRLAQEKADKEAREARERQAEKDREAAEARERADRARLPETQAAKGAVADQAAVNAAEAAATAQTAAVAAQDAHIATLAKPADLVRGRTDGGATVTMRTEAFAIVEDFDQLDMAALWPFVPNDAKEKALRAWAKVHNYNKSMPGAAVGRRPVTAVR